MPKILGLSFFYHDAAAALIVDGKPIAMAEEERFSRKKHDSEFPILAAEFVTKQAGLAFKDLDYIVFYEKPFLKFERIIKNDLATFPVAPQVFVESLKKTFLDKLWIRAIIAKRLKVKPSKILFAEHHLSHAASAFYCSPFDESAIVTIDGVGEWAVTTVGKGQKGKIEILKEIHFPHSIGLLYSAFTAFLGFEVNEGEFKVMGMAPYGQPKYADKVRKLINFYE
jgi:carbamoyltransferase